MPIDAAPTNNGFPPPGHHTEIMQEGLNANGQRTSPAEAMQNTEGGTPAADPIPSKGGLDFMQRAQTAAAKSPRFKKRNALNFDGDRTGELRPVADGGKVKRAKHVDNEGLVKRLDEHQGRVIIRNPDGTTKYMFERQDASGNFDKYGEWCGFDAFGNAMNPASPAEMIKHMVNTSPTGLHFSSYYLNPITADEGDPFNEDRRCSLADVGITSENGDHRTQNGENPHEADEWWHDRTPEDPTRPSNDERRSGTGRRPV